MKAVGFYRYLPIDHAESLLDVELPEPTPAEHDLLVTINAVAVNPVDYKTRSRKDASDTTLSVLGWDAAGVVRAVGAAVTLFKPGDAVYYAGSIARPGANSERHLVDERIVGQMPRNLSFAEAAALPLTTITAYEALFDRLGISATGADAGKTLLIIGGAGGVGSIAIQLAKRLGQLRVIATASQPASAQWVRTLGADEVVDHTKDLAAQLQACSATEVDYIFCCNNTDQHFPAFATIIKPQGKICTIVNTERPVALAELMRKSATIAWELMFTRSLFQTPDMIKQHQLLDDVARLIEQGALRTTLGQNLGTINATNLKRAHQLLEAGHTVGKLVLEGF
ncbi:MAG: zinc-binding alcohol dehydrogenase family protein [Gammaproteobacteria bacterium]|nr:zinc-binding alcohol dehydrogenase family protein [Gammaproteobacteria bacterium]